MTEPAASFSERLLIGLAEHIAAAGLGVWRTEGPDYADDEVGIALVDLPDAPERVIVLDTYDLDRGAFPDLDASDTPVDPVAIAIRTRTGPAVLGSRRLDDALYELLDGATHVHLSTGIELVTVWRTSAASLGRDAAGRRERSASYYALAQRPTPNRPQQ